MYHQVIESEQQLYSRQTKSTQSDQLIESHTKLVKRIAWHVHGTVSSAIEPADLIQIGMVALVESARAFEDRGIAFSAYATTRIRGAMIDHLRKNSAMSRTSMHNKREIERAKMNAEAKYCRKVNDVEISQEMCINLSEYHKLLDKSITITQESLDDVYSDHAMWFADNEDDAHTMLENAEITDLLKKCIEKLPQREAMILQLYFVDELNLDEIATILDLTSARVCQIKKKSLQKLKDMMV
jgi:RNA polymerase sigma factor for flagellar operon FliA